MDRRWRRSWAAPPARTKAVQTGAGGPHRDVQVHGVQGRHDAQGVAADVAVNHALIFRQGVEHAPMGTSGAHNGGTAGNFVFQRDGLLLRPTETAGNDPLGQLVDHGQDVFAADLHADLPAVVLNDGLQLLHHQDLVHLGGKVLDLLHRHRPGQAQLQHAGFVAKDLADILIAGGRGDDADGVLPPCG